MSSHSIKKLTEEEAQDRVNWMMSIGPREFWHLVGWDTDLGLVVDENAVQKLEEIARVARQIAKHYRKVSDRESSSGS